MIRALCPFAIAAIAAAHAKNMKPVPVQDIFTGLTTLPKHGGVKDRMLQLVADNSTFAPQQLHLSLTGNPTEMTVMWVTMGSCVGATRYWPADNASAVATVPATETTYTAGWGWNGTIHNATMTGLIPGTWYQYSVGSGVLGTGTWSLPRKFRAAPQPGPTQNSYVAVVADMGTIAPMGWAVSDEITNEHVNGPQPFDMTIIAGDISYATIDPPKNEVEWTWDAYNIQIEPYAATAPFMTAPGNHENVPGTFTNSSGTTYPIDFAAYQARYSMPGPSSGGNGSMWFSYDFANVHYTAICTELDYTVGSAQWTFVQTDLQAAAARRSTVPWLIVMLHRPVLSADNDEYTSHCPGAPLAVNLGPLFDQYGVDLVVQGHEHCYERTAAVRAANGTVVALPSGPNNVYTNPGAPIYIVQGASGAMQEETFVTPAPAWSLVAFDGTFGFGRMTVNGSSLLSYQFVDIDGFVHDTFSIVKQ